MNRSLRRRPLGKLLFAAALIAAGCTPTQVSAGSAAITALTGAIATITTMITSGNFTGADLTDLQTQLAALNAQLLLLAPTSTSSTISSVFGTVTAIIGDIGTYLPTILQLLPILGILAKPRMSPNAVASHKTAPVDPTLLLQLRQQLLDLKAAGA
jgi:hypothetical protein